METKDWVGVYGALLSTCLALREVWKHRRATRPKLVGYVTSTPIGHSMDVMQNGVQRHGEGREMILHNEGGRDTNLSSLELFAGVRWLPSTVLAMAGEFGISPGARDQSGLGGSLRDGPVAISAGGEATVRVVLWPEHREALDRGRLMLCVSHSWSRHRLQQVRVRPAVD